MRKCKAQAYIPGASAGASSPAQSSAASPVSPSCGLPSGSGACCVCTLWSWEPSRGLCPVACRPPPPVSTIKKKAVRGRPQTGALRNPALLSFPFSGVEWGLYKFLSHSWPFRKMKGLNHTKCMWYSQKWSNFSFQVIQKKSNYSSTAKVKTKKTVDVVLAFK